MSLGPLMLDVPGLDLESEDREILRHPLVGGVILFSRNYDAPEQLARLVESIKGLREPRLLVAVDHEGGRVQRFRESFTQLPASAIFGRIFERDADRAKELAETCGWLLAVELRAVGIDLSFAPVLDVDKGSTVIGDRALHNDPEVVASLARSVMRGMKGAGMAAVGKHFPGHGTVAADSHVAVPVDNRSLESLESDDLVPFERMIHFGLPAIMAAHVVYPKVDSKPAGFSQVWLQSVLRGRLGFQGAVFSDDVSMAGAAAVGNLLDRTRAALDAGCDMVLVCNAREDVGPVLDGLGRHDNPVSRARLVRMHGRNPISREALMQSERYEEAVRVISSLEPEPELDLGNDNAA